MRERGVSDGFVEVSSALRGNVKTYRHDFDDERQDLLAQLEKVMRDGSKFVESLQNTVKYSYCVSAVFCKAVDPDIDNSEDPAFFWSEQFTTLEGDDPTNDFTYAWNQILQKIDTFERNGSGKFISY